MNCQCTTGRREALSVYETLKFRQVEPLNIDEALRPEEIAKMADKVEIRDSGIVRRALGKKEIAEGFDVCGIRCV